MSTNIYLFQVSIYFNICMIKSIFFRCRVVKLQEKEEIELKYMCKEQILSKLVFSKKFPCNALYIRKSVLEISLIALSTILAILKLKLFIGHKRLKENTKDAIEAHKFMY